MSDQRGLLEDILWRLMRGHGSPENQEASDVPLEHPPGTSHQTQQKAWLPSV